MLLDMEDKRVFADFQGLTTAMESHTKMLQEYIKDCEKTLDDQQKILDEQQQMLMLEFQLKQQSQAPQARLQYETDIQSNEKKDFIKKREEGVAEALILYQQTFKKELNDLSIEEPDMSEEMRKRSAKRIAKNSCKSFLKGKLDYTDDEADEFLDFS
ncbi:hypothetical protein LOD99_5998 [Oopsacas minuta]|uniref:Uncharacterized protein n=1 Tax=Oopsacas minuta TaxID=111878 RepID=A0AAV7JPJ1_9METZ|nr:hypothetical protein LOD99_5998 [Oopsacas minuta]